MTEVQVEQAKHRYKLPKILGTKRKTELVLLAVALALTITANMLVSMRLFREITPEAITISLAMIGVAALTHIAIRLFVPDASQVIFPIVLLLNGIGLAMIYQVDSANNGSGVNIRQVVWTCVACVLAICVMFLVKNQRMLRKYMYIFMLIGIVLLFLPLVPPFGTLVNGAQVWIHIGPLSMQPAEFAKIFLAIFFAAYLDERKATLSLAGPKIMMIQFPRLRDFAPLAIVLAAAVGILVFQRDLGTSLLFFGQFLAMLYVSTRRFSWVAIGLGLFTVAVFVSVNIFEHVAARFQIWLDPFNPEVYARAFGGSGQLLQGLFGLSSGGLLGVGFGGGYPQLTPFADSDFIFTSLGEVLGLQGIIALLLLYLILVAKGMHMAMIAKDGFTKLLASGLAFSIVLQVFVVAGGVMRVIPLTGLTLPFMAKGGTSLCANWIIMALLLVISNRCRSANKAEALTKNAQTIAQPPLVIPRTSLKTTHSPSSFRTLSLKTSHTLHLRIPHLMRNLEMEENANEHLTQQMSVRHREGAARTPNQLLIRVKRSFAFSYSLLINKLLIKPLSLLITHYSLLINKLLITHYSLLINKLLITHYSLLIKQGVAS
ncbi:MAG: FtsW/RodA/SpoVE family cell cycle protein [Bifidobacteriaceae bacterium]|jgi:cell division protein FtsW (lipid II flippase)|nr:FtsW/RodA/SpoVE family cell cycle protein [Bifidobacteriaceae bacterium]